ncbi:carbohydrate-binding module family 14 protein [Pseudomonas donghuensis]|uniref:carbohydrate-binding module family 14 protein n=1 Tax=Pseudomonas donghuensis TaxID=1163398 RepID=UPI0039DFEA04
MRCIMSYRSRNTAYRTLGRLIAVSALAWLAGCSSSGGISNEQVQVDCAAAGAGNHPNPTDCTRYYNCLFKDGKWYRFSFTCPAGAFYSVSARKCAVASSCPNAAQPATGQVDPALPERRQLVR